MTQHHTVEDIEVTFLAHGDDTRGFLHWLNTKHHAIGFDVETGGPDPLNPFASGFEVRAVAFADERRAWVLDGKMHGLPRRRPRGGEVGPA